MRDTDRDTVRVEGVGKQFRRFHPGRPATLQEALLSGLRRRGAAERFWALRDVSFRVAPGRMVGVIGSNGSGKSTLLRLLGGIGRPDTGRVQVQGRIGALLELGAGFHDDLTGRENVFVSGVVAGLTRAEVAQRFDSIVDFAELPDFIDNPVRTFSTGMKMRLAFAVAVHIDPDILLIDEVLAVGDIAFQRKCLARIAQFKAQGCTILLVTHEPTQVRELCDEALWLRAGRVVAHGPAEVVVGQYVSEMRAETQRRTPARPPVRTTSGQTLQVNENRFGSLEMEIARVHLLDARGHAVTEVTTGNRLSIEIEYFAPQPIADPIFNVSITRPDASVCFSTSVSASELGLPTIRDAGKIALHLERLDLVGGPYFVDVGVYEREWVYAYDYHWHVHPLLVGPMTAEGGTLRPPTRWEVIGQPLLRASLSALRGI